MVWNHALYFYVLGHLDGQMPIQAIATKRNHGSHIYDIYKMFSARGHNGVGILLKKSWDIFMEPARPAALTILGGICKTPLAGLKKKPAADSNPPSVTF
ncbi:MAG: hypothetical protein NTV10_01700 [Methanoregula sp.]|nr:hypothetical protein [Methanoregula sp.]